MPSGTIYSVLPLVWPPYSGFPSGFRARVSPLFPLRIIFDAPEDKPPSGFKPGAILEDWDRPFLELAEEDVPGRINNPEYYSFWRDVLEAPEDILEIIREGYAVPFINGLLPPLLSPATTRVR